MLVSIDMPKWEQDPEFYNRKYIREVQKNWQKCFDFHFKRMNNSKKESTKEQHGKWVKLASDNILYASLLLDCFPIELPH